MHRPTCRQAWRGTMWEMWYGQHWQPLNQRPGIILSAWNPRGLRRSISANQQLDAALHRHLMHDQQVIYRARGRSADSTWHEHGWLIAADPIRALTYLRRYRQLAALLIHRHGRQLLWCDGQRERWST